MKKTEHFLTYGSLLVSLQLLLLPASILVFSTILFWASVPITAAHFLVGLGTAVGGSYGLARKYSPFKWPHGFEKKDFWRLTALFLAIVLTAMLLGMAAYDFSYDGQGYHQPGIMALANGWNPVSEPFLENHSPFYGKVIGPQVKFINHYPKASWIPAAAVLKLTGSIEAGKMFHFIFLAAAFLMTLHFLYFTADSPGFPGRYRHVDRLEPRGAVPMFQFLQRLPCGLAVDGDGGDRADVYYVP